jgi:hypothetical protein
MTSIQVENGSSVLRNKLETNGPVHTYYMVFPLAFLHRAGVSAVGSEHPIYDLRPQMASRAKACG